MDITVFFFIISLMILMDRSVLPTIVQQSGSYYRPNSFTYYTPYRLIPDLRHHIPAKYYYSSHALRKINTASATKIDDNTAALLRGIWIYTHRGGCKAGRKLRRNINVLCDSRKPNVAAKFRGTEPTLNKCSQVLHNVTLTSDHTDYPHHNGKQFQVCFD